MVTAAAVEPTAYQRVERRLEKLLVGDPTFAPVVEVALGPAKRLRTMLALASTCAFGLPERVGIELAVATELVHTVSLIHDDIEDGAGAAMHALAWRVLLDLDSLDIARLFATTLQRMASGRALDLMWARDRRNDVSSAEYIAMVRGKTGALLGFAASAPAWLVWNRGAERMCGFGEELGIAFQLLDDVAAGCDGKARALELAQLHVERARSHVAAARPPCGRASLDHFADVMIERLLENLS